ncbi:MAG: hypothetical protein HC808_16250 [Candidatus Competibacteraceae bacterium]|nr:hypothetical protein [Candidatus Competibacteraceae bacterium]
MTTINRDTVTLTQLRSSQDPFDHMDAKNLGDGQIEIHKGKRGLLSGTKLEKLLMNMGFYKDTRIAQKNAKIVLQDALRNEHGQDFQEKMFTKFNINVNSLAGNTVSRQLMDAIATQAAFEKGVNPRVAPYVQQQRQQLNEAQEHQYQEALANQQHGDIVFKPQKDTLLRQVMMGVAPQEHADPNLEQDFRRYATGKGQIKQANLDFLREVHAFDQMDKNDPNRVATFQHIVTTYADEINADHQSVSDLKSLNQQIHSSPQNAAFLIGDTPFGAAASRVDNMVSARARDYINANNEIAEKENRFRKETRRLCKVRNKCGISFIRIRSSWAQSAHRSNLRAKYSRYNRPT